ncbi:MAG: helix-turn-helix domain-containing protein [Flavobacteriales bacterium]
MLTFKNLIRSRYFLFLLSATIVIVCIGFFTIAFEEKQLFPANNLQQYHIDSYHEEIDNYSKTQLAINDKELKLNYTLTDKKDEPFVALFLEKNIKEEFLLNTKKFNAVAIHLKSKVGKRIPLTLKFDYPNYIGKKFPEIPFTKVIDYKGEQEYNISLDDFEVRSWWLRFYGVNKTDEPIVNHQNLKYFVVGNCEALKPNINDEITISSIYFYHDNSKALLILFIITVTIYLGTYIFYRKQKTVKEKQQILVPIQSVHISAKNTDKKIDKIKNYIGEHFSNADLSVSDLQNDLGISSREIGQLIKSELNSSFSVYINMVRISEVKRLLKESDAPVSEIAYKCGYQSNSAF